MRRPEQTLQIQVARYLGVALRAPSWWTAIGHGGGGRVRGAILKGMGVRRGVPDLIVIHPIEKTGNRAGCWLLGIELKTKTGRLSTEQKAAHAALKAAGMHVSVCRSIEEVEHVLEEFGVPLFARVGGGE